ncbi:acetamidase/formamidase family protein [Aestuariivirga litoralis]|uniref:acetamidase/formamidase family protein n=1 Tax=Aestuariivirga litoralis TaxID=2650924 RepID=UPI0018C645CC|nr:acetamidase/formamidase family protein [Aestuariivirga litoralis]MBG1230866.1 acetamidase [Aestuariivirga litoralis]
MAHHNFSPSTYFQTIGSHAAALVIADGDTVTVSTLDANGYDLNNAHQAADPNPMSGPFFIEGAAPGDALAVEIIEIEMTRATGWTRQGLAWHLVDPHQVRAMPPREKIFWDINPRQNSITLQKPPAALKDWSIPIVPMIGCFGVAPDGGEAISTATSGHHGGNMDYRGFGEGVTAYFPVSVPGALFFLGDVHGAQGDGEIAGTGIETSAEITFKVRLLKNRKMRWPRGENETSIFTVGNARPLDQALQHATTEMLVWLEQDYGLDKIAASHFLGMNVRYDVANVFNPAYSVACRLEKSALAALK